MNPDPGLPFCGAGPWSLSAVDEACTPLTSLCQQTGRTEAQCFLLRQQQLRPGVQAGTAAREHWLSPQPVQAQPGGIWATAGHLQTGVCLEKALIEPKKIIK